MDAERFQRARESLAALLDEGVESLDDFVSSLRPDGLPQDWIDDIPNLTVEQCAVLAGDIPDGSPTWALTLRNHLTA